MEEINTAKTENQVKPENVTSQIEKMKEEESEPEKINKSITDITVGVNDEQEKINIVTQKINEIRNELGLQGSENNFPSTDYNKNKIIQLESKRTSLKEALLKIGRIAAISAIGIMPGKLNGQDTIKNTGIETRIENNEQLKSKIFNEVELGYKNGILKNKPDAAYFFRLQKDGYDITYDMDDAQDNKKDKYPTITVDYMLGNSNYIIKKGPGINGNIDLVYNYKDNFLAGAETESYEDFFNEHMILIGELYGKNTTPVNYRSISPEEKQKFLADLEGILRKPGIDSTAINENNANIKRLEEKIQLQNQIENEEKEELNIGQNIFDYLKNDKNLDKKFDEMAEENIVTVGNYTYKFGSQILSINFIDQDGYKYQLDLDVIHKEVRRARKLKKIGNKIDIVKIANPEIKKILEDSFNVIKKE